MVKIIENYEIKNESTFRIGGTVDKVAFPNNTEELISLLKSGEYDIVLGGCSNVLFSSNKIHKSIILTKNINDFTIEGKKIKVSCGTRGALVSKECKERSLTGFEFLIGFPGSFGGMIYMNASAHNQAISDTFISCRVFDTESKEVKTFRKEDMNFSYRNSVLSNNNFVLIDAEFELKEGNKEYINDITERNLEFRKTKQPPLKYGNAGSTFKNPENDSAGRLLDLCGLKGEKEGGAMVYENHANFVINYNNASSSDVLTLMYKMYSKVKEKYTMELQPEIKYIGDKETKEYELWETMTGNMQTTQK